MTFVNRLKLVFVLVAFFSFLLGYFGFSGMMRIRYAFFNMKVANKIMHYISLISYNEDMYVVTKDERFKENVRRDMSDLMSYMKIVRDEDRKDLFMKLALFFSNDNESEYLGIISESVDMLFDVINSINSNLDNYIDLMKRLSDSLYGFLVDLKLSGHDVLAKKISYMLSDLYLNPMKLSILTDIEHVLLNSKDKLSLKGVEEVISLIRNVRSTIVNISDNIKSYQNIIKSLHTDVWFFIDKQKSLMRKSIVMTVTSTTVLFVLLMLSLLITGYRFVSLLSRYLSRMSAALDSIRNGDFTYQLAYSPKDGEFGMMAEEYNHIMSVLNESVGYIIKVSQEALETKVLGVEWDTSSESNPLVMAKKVVESLVELNRYKNVIESDYDKSEIYKHLYRVLKDRFGVYRVMILELNESKNRFESVFCECIDGAPIDVVVNPDICRAKRTAGVVDAKEFPEICRFAVDDNDTFSVCIPMVMGGGVKGVVKILEDDENREILMSNLPFIIKYIEITAPVVYAAKLLDITREQSLKDGLTGLYNRRFLDSYLEKYISFADRKGFIVGFIMIDIDNFKKVNDTYGHKNGDIVLKEVARVVSSSVRSSDLVIRYGGEEFLVVLPDVSEGKSLDVAEKIRKSVEMTSIHIEGKILHVTISAGVAEYPVHSDDVQQVIKYADIALYKAKKTGKNKVVMFNEEEMADMINIDGTS